VGRGHDGDMTVLLLLVGIVLAIGILAIRYGVDSRVDDRGL